MLDLTNSLKLLIHNHNNILKEKKMNSILHLLIRPVGVFLFVCFLKGFVPMTALHTK